MVPGTPLVAAPPRARKVSGKMSPRASAVFDSPLKTRLIAHTTLSTMPIPMSVPGR